MYKLSNNAFDDKIMTKPTCSTVSSSIEPTTPFPEQKPGTSGLRKKMTQFLVPRYMENFVQCIYNAMRENLQGSTIVLGGDGRYGVRDATLLIAKMAAANGVRKLIIGKDGILSTPAASCIIRKFKTDGGIILTASHNPGGVDGDFGIKFNLANGGPAPSEFTDLIYEFSGRIENYRICHSLKFDVGTIGVYEFLVSSPANDQELPFTVEVIDPLQDYVDLMKNIFDFEAIKDYLRGTKIILNSLHGVTGPYVERIFGLEFGLDRAAFMKTELLPDFGGGHPDPNLTYASDLVEHLRQNKDIQFGVAFDGDGDRNMILGQNSFFVTPCDSLAVIADNIHVIPYFSRFPIKGYARSMPTSAAIDRVALAKGLPYFETPTGWKYFGNLLEAGKISICGEESFGTGSDHIREKDGIWAALAWLQILAARKLSVEEILLKHWQKYGRNVFTRYDYENAPTQACDEMMLRLRKFVSDHQTAEFMAEKSKTVMRIVRMDDFEYIDPVDGSIASKQGVRIFFEDGSRLVFRLSGTGSSGATVRIYADRYLPPEELFEKPNGELRNVQNVLAPCLKIALTISQLTQFTGRRTPDVIT